MQMLEYVRQGKPSELQNYLMKYSETGNLNEGKVAGDALRQAKNIFIALVAVIGKTAAIPGGMPIEEAYYLIDTYTQQCELMKDAEEIYILQYNMILDFAERVEKYRSWSNLSPLIRDCTNFITFHLNEPIRAIDVIEYSGRSRSYLSARFKKETGYEIGSYITWRKIEEAKLLLCYSDKTISEISTYLAFSSQPYFHNVFKKISGTTPLQYRETCKKC